MAMQRGSRGMTPWRPFWDTEDIERRFGELLGRPLTPFWRHMPSIEKEWMPAVDVYEKDDKFVVKAEIPGMKPEDVDVSVTDDMVTIKGEKKTESEVNDEDYYRCERTYGSFYRSIPLPSNVDADKIEASYDDGVLEVTVPKTAKATPKKIKVGKK